METAAIAVEQHQHGCTVRVGGLITEALVTDLQRLSRDMGMTKLDLRGAWLSTEGAEALRTWYRLTQGTLELVLPDTIAPLLAAEPLAESADAGSAGNLGAPVDLPALLAHELRGPLTVAHLRLQTLSTRLAGQGLTEEASSCRSALKGLDAVSRLFDTYITASRPWTLGPVNLLSLCEEASADAQEATGRGQIVVRCVPPELGAWVNGERQALRQLIWNLVRNGLEAGGDAPDVLVEVRLAGKTVDLMVSDVGPGFPEDVLAAPFSPRRSRKPGGMGIGLVLCQWITERHGGRISLGRTDHGALVRVVLPRAVAPTTAPAAAPPPSPPPTRALLRVDTRESTTAD